MILDSQTRVTTLNQTGARFVLCPLLYKFMTMTAMMTDSDVIVITTQRYIPENVLKVTDVLETQREMKYFDSD